MTETSAPPGSGPGRHSSPSDDPGSEELDFVAIQGSAEFAELRRRLYRFVFPVTALFLAWYLGYVLLAAYAPEFMGVRLFGTVTVGLVLGLLQFVTTVIITVGYGRFAARRLDPQADLIRNRAGERQ